MCEPDAIRHICEVVDCSDEDAKRDFHGRVLDRKIEMRARRAEFKPADGEGGDWLRFNELLTNHRVHGHVVEWADDRMVISEDSQKEATGRPTGRIVATGVEFRCQDVLRLWPAPEREHASPKTEIAPNKGGRPPIYDREKIDAFVIAYIVENAPETRAEVVSAIQAKFEAESLPGARSLERLVSKVFKYLEEFKQARGDKT